MPNVNRQLLEIKKNERATMVRRHESELQELDRKIAALEVAAKIEDEENGKESLAAGRSKLDRDVLYKERRDSIVPILPRNGNDLYHKEIADRLGLHPEALKDWMQVQVRLHADCPWTFGRNKSYFKLTDTYRLTRSLNG